MYGVSKINIEPSLMMISVQDVEFKGNSLARYLLDLCRYRRCGGYDQSESPLTVPTLISALPHLPAI